MRGVHRILCFFAAGFAIAQPAGTGVIGGTVIDNSTGDPVKKAIVTLTWHGQPKSWATGRTTSDGRFRFEGLPAGDYDLHAEKQGVGTAVWGADRVGELGDLIPLANGQTRDNLQLKFLHASSISGHVLDSDGEPVDASITLYRPGRNLGERILVRSGGAQTNDRGEYKLNNVRPGHYYVAAGPLGYFPDATTRPVTVFFGDERDWKNSRLLIIRDGESLAGIDLHMVAEPTVRLHGRVTGVPEASQPQGSTSERAMGQRMFPAGFVNVTVASLDEFNQGYIGFGAAGPDYEFDGSKLPSGRYRIEASFTLNGKMYAASQTIDLQPGTGEVELALAPATDLKGHLKLEGGTAVQASGIQVTLARADRTGIGSVGPFIRDRQVTAHVAADGNFTLEQVPPGEWELTLSPMPRISFLKSVRLGDKDVRFERFQIESGSDASLSIVVSMHGAKITGHVDAGIGDARRAGILLAPTGQFHDLARFYYAVAADDDGKFKINGITPGKYKIFALERISAANYRSPEAADALDALVEGGAPEIELVEGATIEVHPQLIPFERAHEVTP